MLVRLTGALLAALALLAAPSAGAAQKLSRVAQLVYDDYRSDAAIQPCDHSVADYRRTLREITPDIEEETPAFRPAVEAALREAERRRVCPGSSDGGSQGGSSGGGSTGSASPPAQSAPPAASPAPAPPAANAPPPAPAGEGAAPQPSASATPTPTVAPPPPVASSAPAAPGAPVLVDRPRDGTPVGLLIALGLLALTALLALLAVLVTRLGWGGERLAGTRHAWGEAAYRAGATWADFVDWLRLGRGSQRL